MTTLHFNRNAAENRGVRIEPVILNFYACNDFCSCKQGADYCDQPAEIVKYKAGYRMTLPTGLSFMAFSNNYFDCTVSNKEAKEWFLKNVRGSHLSF